MLLGFKKVFEESLPGERRTWRRRQIYREKELLREQRHRRRKEQSELMRQ